jgi:hypothetical protein
MSRRALLCGVFAAGVAGMASFASASSFTVANFEDGMTDGFGTATNSGVTANSFASPTTGTINTPATGTDTTQVLDLFAAGFNGGLTSGADLGFDFKASGLATQFLANDVLTFNWEVPPSATTSGYSQLYNIILNAPGAGFVGVGGSSGATSPLAVTTGTVNQNPTYSGQLNTVSINYDAYKAAISANPSYLQLEIQTNNGGGAPSDMYFDNFTLSTVPEPASLGMLVVAGAGMLGRRRRV